MLRQNLALALSAELDDQGLNGAASEADDALDLTGLFSALGTAPAAASTAADFDDFVAAFADGIDGLWSTTAKQVGMVVGVDSYRLAAKTFRDVASTDLGSISFADYAMGHYGGFWTNSRMPATASNVQQAILYRMGRSAEAASEGMRTAVCPVWSEIMIDDMYTGSAKGERYLTFHVLCGDVLVVQPGAYKRVSFKVS